MWAVARLGEGGGAERREHGGVRRWTKGRYSPLRSRAVRRDVSVYAVVLLATQP